MVEFLKCELFIFLKLFGLTLLVILIVNIIGATSYLKVLFMASIVVFLIYIIVIIKNVIFLNIILLKIL